MKDASTFGSYVSENYGGFLSNPSAQVAKTQQKLDPLQAENGIPEYNSGKRKIIWRLKNVKG